MENDLLQFMRETLVKRLHALTRAEAPSPREPGHLFPPEVLELCRAIESCHSPQAVAAARTRARNMVGCAFSRAWSALHFEDWCCEMLKPSRKSMSVYLVKNVFTGGRPFYLRSDAAAEVLANLNFRLSDDRKRVFAEIIE
jgi:hypothetical protein